MMASSVTSAARGALERRHLTDQCLIDPAKICMTHMQLGSINEAHSSVPLFELVWLPANRSVQALRTPLRLRHLLFESA